MDRTAETTWDWDWDGDPIDRSLTPARLTPDGELEPIAVDESLTTLLFTPHRVAAAPPSEPIASPAVEAMPVQPRASADLQGALFEMA